MTPTDIIAVQRDWLMDRVERGERVGWVTPAGVACTAGWEVEHGRWHVMAFPLSGGQQSSWFSTKDEVLRSISEATGIFDPERTYLRLQSAVFALAQESVRISHIVQRWSETTPGVRPVAYRGPCQHGDERQRGPGMGARNYPCTCPSDCVCRDWNRVAMGFTVCFVL